MKPGFLFPLFFTVWLLTACDGNSATGNTPETSAQAAAAETATTPEPSANNAGPGTFGENLSLDDLERKLDIPALSRPWTGDLDGMVERRVVRVLTVYGVGRYYLEGVQQKGIVYEAFQEFEDFLNKRLKNKTIRVHVVFIPVARNELIPALINGRGDIAVAGLTITPEREAQVDFTEPTTREISEVLVTGPSAPPVGTIDDLAGHVISVRRSSSYYSSLQALNSRLAEAGKDLVQIDESSEYLEDEDLLEMVNAGMLPWVVVDDYKARKFTEMFSNIEVRDDIVFREGGRLGWAVRKNSPKLLADLNLFLKSHRQGTLLGNVLINRYYRDADWAQNALEAEHYERLNRLVELFQKYGDQYSFDYLIVAAQGYQESQLDQSARSEAGAVGIMQLLPSTAADPNVGIPDISKEEPNIHAGIRYLNFIRSRYFDEPGIDPMNQTLFALASYNAGPARIVSLRKKAAEKGYDPNLWFDNVEVVVAREVGSETVKYVSNILKYYVAYSMSLRRLYQRSEERRREGLSG